MPLMPLSSPSFSLLPELLHRQDEWDILLQYLSLSDLGNLRAVSSEFRAAITPAHLESAARDCILQEEGGEISSDALQQFRFHPAAQGLVDEGRLASACFASLHHVRQPQMTAEYVAPIPVDFPLQFGPMDFIQIPQTRTGALVVCRVGAQKFVPKYAFQARDAAMTVTLAVPDGFFLVGPSSEFVGGRLHCSRHSLVSTPDLLLLANQAGRLHCFDMEEGTLAALPMTLPGAGMIATSLSNSGRFVALLTQDEASDTTRLQCFDRERDSLITDIRENIDNGLYQVMVGDDGRLFAGGHGQSFVFHGNIAEAHSFVSDEGLAFNATFMLSSDGRFLIRSCFSHTHSGNDVMLQDLKLPGRDIILPRIAPPQGSGWRMQPASIGFSALNRLAAIAYIDGAVQVFDLNIGETAEARVLARSFVPQTMPADPHISFDGFDRVHILYQDDPMTMLHYVLNI